MRLTTSTLSLVLAAALLAACGPASYTVPFTGNDHDTGVTPVDTMVVLPDGNMVPAECAEGASTEEGCAATALTCAANRKFCHAGRWTDCHLVVRMNCTEGVTDAGVPDVGAPDTGPPPPANCSVMGRDAVCLHGTECVSGVCADGSTSLVRCTNGALTLTRACPAVIVDAGMPDTGPPDVGTPDVGVDVPTDTTSVDVPPPPASCLSLFGSCISEQECYSGVCADGTFTRGLCVNGVFTLTRRCPVPDAGAPDTGTPDVVTDAVVDASTADAAPEASVDASMPDAMPDVSDASVADTGPTFAIDDPDGGVVFAAAGITGSLVISELVPFTTTAVQTTMERGVTFYEIAPMAFRIADGRFRFQVTVNGQPLAGISGGHCVRTGILGWWQFDVFDKRTGYYMEWYPETVDGVCAFTVARWPWIDSYWTIASFVADAQYYLARLDAGMPDAAMDASTTDASADAVADAMPDVVVDVTVTDASTLDASTDVSPDATSDAPADVASDAAPEASVDVPVTIDTVTVTGLASWTSVTMFSVNVFPDTTGGSTSVSCAPNLMSPPSATCTGTLVLPFRVSTHIVSSADLSGLPVPGLRQIYDPGIYTGSSCSAFTVVRVSLTGGRTATCTAVANSVGTGCDYLCR